MCFYIMRLDLEQGYSMVILIYLKTILAALQMNCIFIFFKFNEAKSNYFRLDE